ncbi:cytochrome P450 [Schizophyllum commune Loenen D]|nr:cytochrome P450 [Schizophyllum commune Loenen D]
MANIRSPGVAVPSAAETALYNMTSPSHSFLPQAQGGSTWLFTTATIVVSLLLLEQAVYKYKKRHLPGASWTIPIIGKFMDSLHPTLENYMKQWAMGDLSVVSVFNIFIVMAASNDYSRKILNTPCAEPAVVNSAKHVLCPENWVFLNGKAHVEYRRGLNALFTRKALGSYVDIQDRIAKEHLQDWVKKCQTTGKSFPIMMDARFMNMVTSIRVFCGMYVPDDAIAEISQKYWDITVALELVNFPLPIPGTKIYRAIQARKVAFKWLEHAAHESKIAMAAGKTAGCLLDEWCQVLNDPTYKGRKDFSDREMALVVFSFLFASQDAMSSGLTYGFQHLVDHPDVFAKIREELDRVVGRDPHAVLTLDLLDQLPYLQAAVKESMRVKPPVTMIPYKTVKPFQIREDYTVPTGTLLIPTFYNSLHDPNVYPEPEAFKPERWLDPEGSANKNPKNWIGFGNGAHRCIGQEYALMNIALVLANAVMLADWEHDITEDSFKVKMIATLFPADECKIKFTPRAVA